MKTLAVDLGNRNTKTSEEVIFPSRYSMLSQLNSEIVTYNNKQYFISKGEYDIELRKADKDYMPLLLAAIAKSTNEQQINLVLNCPINQKDTKEKFKKDLEGQLFNFSYTNTKGKTEERFIYINKLTVILEGLGAVKMLPKEAGRRSVLIDIGGWTTNVIYISDGVIVDAFVVQKGILSFYKLIKDREERDGTYYTLEEIEDAIDKEVITNVQEEKILTFNEIIKAIKNRRNIKNYDIYFSGGASTNFKEYIKKISCKILNNNVFANVLGNKIIAEEKWNNEIRNK